jgi:hypothetical protein
VASKNNTDPNNMALKLSDGLDLRKKFKRRDLFDAETRAIKAEVTLNGKVVDACLKFE